MSTNVQMILIVEDSPDDAFFLQYELNKLGNKAQVQVVEDGEQAIDYFSGAGEYADRAMFPLPTLVFLDLKLPFRSGFDVLVRMREQPELSGIPVFVLTGSSEARDRARAKNLGVRDYLVKPLRADKLREVMQSLTLELAPSADGKSAP